MRLSIEDIKKITFGAVYIEDNEGEFIPHRFTKEQEEIYDRLAPMRADGVRAAAGVVIDFSTDSESLSFIIRATKKPNIKGMKAALDIYEGDLMIYSASVGTDAAEHSLSLSRGEKRVRIYLNTYLQCRVSSFCLDDGATITPTQHKVKALIYGDSITHGSRASHPSLTYANIISEHFGWESINQGVGGEIFRSPCLGTARLCDADYITVAYGTNDWHSKDKEATGRDAEAFFKHLRELYPDATVFYISPTWRSECYDEAPGGDFFESAKMLEEIASSAGAHIVSGLSLVPHIEDFFTDGLHPNDLGFSIYSRSLIKTISGKVEK